MYEDDYQLLLEENGIARNAGIVYETKDLYRNLTIQLKFFNKFWCVCACWFKVEKSMPVY